MGWIVTAGVGAVALIAVMGLWARHRLVLVTVMGSSMEPTLFSGDRVLVHRRGLAGVRRGQLVVLEPPLPDGVHLVDPASRVRHRWNIKRVVALPGDPVPAEVTHVEGAERVPQGALVVFGDSAMSADSRQRGFYLAADLLGVVVRRISSPDR